MPVVISNGDLSWFVWLYKSDGGDSIEGYYISCQDDSTGIEENSGVIDSNFNILSYEEFTALEGSTCNYEAFFDNPVSAAIANMLSGMEIQFDGISGEPPSDEDLTEKALYYYSE